MTTLTPAQRALRARLAAFSQHAQGRTNTGPAFDARVRKLEAQVDPDARLAPDERARRVGFAMKAEMCARSLAASRARSRRQAARPDHPASVDRRAA